LRGARFDSWDKHLRLDLWQEAFEHFGIETERYLGTIPVTARTPWDHFDIGLEDGFLAREYRKALAGRASPPCGKVAGAFIHATNVSDAQAEKRRLVCYDCGVACDLGKMREERLVFLRKLGAHERPQPVIPAPAAAAPAEPATPGVETPGAETDVALALPPAPKKLRKARPETFRPARPGGAPVGYRLRFEKTGPSALLGHLDLARELPRALRRSGARLRYSQGFHPKPDLSFGPALSLGVASLDEYVDARLIDAPSPAELVQRLAAATSSGLSFLDAVLLGPDDPPVSSIVNAARYVVGLAAPTLRDSGGEAALVKRIGALLAKTEAIVRRDVGGVGKKVDVRRYLRELSLGDERALEALERGGIVGALLPLEVTIAITPTGSAKISEVVEALFGHPVEHLSVRAALLTSAGTPLELEPHRRVRPAPAQAQTAQA
jgi:radical SAM-linked protein